MKVIQITLVSLFLCLLHLHAASSQLADASKPVDTSNYTGVIKLACVGDSITAGHGVSKGMSWPDQIQKMLGDTWKVNNFGVSGTTLMQSGDRPYRKTGAFSKAKEFAPDVVVIMLGTNDTKPQNWAKREDFPADYKSLIEEFSTLPSKPRIFLCSPSYIVGQGNFGISQANTQEELPWIVTVAQATGAGLIDVHAAMHGKDDLIPDKVHPNDAGAGVIAATVFQVLTGKKPPR
jgi:lysophospholipase L1-like esterase